MNVAMIGYGKMGKRIVSLMGKGKTLKLIIDPSAGRAPKGVCKFPYVESVPQELLDAVDVFIEFTEPSKAKKNISSILKRKKGARIVCGTTGWNARELAGDLRSKKAVLLHSANFSLGINAISSMLPHLLETLKRDKGLKASMTEHHHKQKKDKPSGTAKMLAEVIKTQGLTCPIESIREGSCPGIHIIRLNSGNETIEIKHEVRDRDVFCAGVLLALEWIKKVKKPGIYDFGDTLR